MGINATEEESDDDESEDTIKKLQTCMKQPLTLGGPSPTKKGATPGGYGDL